MFGIVGQKCNWIPRFAYSEIHTYYTVESGSWNTRDEIHNEILQKKAVIGIPGPRCCSATCERNLHWMITG